MKPWIPACAAFCLALAAGAAEAGEFAWSGTYSGSFVCDDVTDGEAGSLAAGKIIKLRQTGDRIDLFTESVIDPAVGASTTLYRGRVMASPAGDVVSGYPEACGGSFAHEELVRIFPAATARVPFSFAADTVFVSDAVPGVEGKLVAESCKWSTAPSR